MGARGPKPKETCSHGHNDWTTVKRGKYVERQCAECRRIRSREWWQKNRAKTPKKGR